jgi:hypothetical protein
MSILFDALSGCDVQSQSLDVNTLLEEWKVTGSFHARIVGSGALLFSNAAAISLACTSPSVRALMSSEDMEWIDVMSQKIRELITVKTTPEKNDTLIYATASDY